MYVNVGHHDWDTYLPYATLAVNTHVNDSIGVAPFYTMFGRDPKLSIDLELSDSTQDGYQELTTTYAQEIQEKFKFLRTCISQTLDQAQIAYKGQYDRKIHDHCYALGDYVLRPNRMPTVGLTQKLLPKYVGPFKILDVDYPNIIIQLPQGGTEKIHVNDTKPYSLPPNASTKLRIKDPVVAAKEQKQPTHRGLMTLTLNAATMRQKM